MKQVLTQHYINRSGKYITRQL